MLYDMQVQSPESSSSSRTSQTAKLLQVS